MSNELENIASGNKATRRLHKIHFDFAEAEVSYTDLSQGGAASGMDEPILLKAVTPKKEDLSKEQEEILSSVGEEFNPLLKQKIDKEAHSSSSEDEDGEDNKVTKGNPMSDENTNERIAELEKQLAVVNAEKSLISYEFDTDLNKEVVEAVSELTDAQAATITKAFDALIAQKDEAVEKATKDAKAPEENDLQKSLEKEAGNEAEPEPDATTLNDRIAKQIDKAQGED